MKKNLVLTLMLASGLLYCTAPSVYATVSATEVQASQKNITVKGKVVDESGEPVIGAGVMVKGTNKGVPTDMDGNFTIDVKAGTLLEISSIGYQIKVVEAAPSMNVVLTADTAMLEEVVAIGYGSQKKVNLTGSVTTVGSKNLEKRPLSNITQALQGQLPGVMIKQQGGGQPGREGMSIEIRGRNSFSTGSAPLVVIDGIVANSMDDVDINTVESVSVLKDAASAAIYGARAANGVILITTKKGTDGEKLNLTYSGKFLYQTPYMFPERIYDAPEYMRMHDLAQDNAGSWWGRYGEDRIALYEAGDNPEYQSYNYMDHYIKNVGIMTHNLSISGQSGKTNYYVGGNIWTQDGLIEHFTYNKYDVLANVESQVNDWIKFGVSASLKMDKQTEPYTGTPTFMQALFSMRPTFGPTVTSPEGEELYTFRRWAGLDWCMLNPQALIDKGGITDFNKLFRYNGYIELNPLPGLKWTTKIAGDFKVRDYSQVEPKVDFYTIEPLIGEPMWGRSRIAARNQMEQGYRSTILSTLSYEKSFGEHNLNVLAGFSQEDNRMKFLSGFRNDFPNLDVTDLNAGSVNEWSNAGSVFVNNAFRSWFGRINYNYKYRYLLEANFRYDGSSRFPAGNRYAFFPSISAAWRISEESFVKDNAAWIDNLKLRASFGKMGNNAIGDFPYQATLSGGINYPFVKVENGYAKTGLTNQSIKWETTDNYGIGLDATLWKGMFDMTLDFYSKRTSGILRGTQLPGYVGLGAPTVNEGIVSNKGFELTLGHRHHIGDLSYGLSFNISKNWNKLVNFGAPQLGFYMMKEGYEMNRYFTYVSDGLFQNQEEIDAAPEQLSPKNSFKPGDMRLKDIDGDGKITPDDRVDMDGAHPDFLYGGNLFLEWKGLDFSAVFQGVHGVKTNINDTHILPWGNGNAPLTFWRDAWTPENTDTDVPILKAIWPASPWHQTYNVASSWFLKDASYFRLKNMSLGYTLPEKLFQNFFVKSVRLAASVENVFTITPFKFGDPERPDSTTYPTLRTFSFSLDIKF